MESTATVNLNCQGHIIENSSIYIPKQSVNCLVNNTDQLLHLIEVQSGSYLSENDIKRLEDLYQKIGKKEELENIELEIKTLSK